jgi:hypothetical protein
MTRSAAATAGTGWDARLYPGLHLAALPQDTSDALAQALGTLGVEAEYFLELTRSLGEPAPPGAMPRERGERFLLAADASARRLLALAQPLELATQAYVSALERPTSGPRQDGGDVWWPATEAEFALGEPLELSLRRCGFSYRHAVAAHLAPNVEAIGEYLHLVLHALNTLPPPGIVPHATLSSGLSEIAATLQSHIIPHHIADLSRDVPGLLSGIPRLYELDAAEGAILSADLEWARAQLAAARAEAQRLKEQPRSAAGRQPGGLMGMMRRALGGAPAATRATPAAWLAATEREWAETIAALQAIEKAGDQGSRHTHS